MATLLPQNTFETEVTFADADPAGDTFLNGGNTVLIIRNKNINPRTITIPSPGQCSFGLTNNAAHNKVIVISGDATGNGTFLFLRLNPGQFNDGNNLTTVNYSNNGNGLAVALVI
jgi:hypothetical protein